MLQDRESSFEPVIVAKRQKDISQIDEKIMPDIEEWQNRPLDDIYPIVFIDAVHFSVRESIAAAFPETEYQRCIVHQIRNTLKYVSYKHCKDFANNLKSIYGSPTENLLTVICLKSLKDGSLYYLATKIANKNGLSLSEIGVRHMVNYASCILTDCQNESIIIK